jgi:CheY-like chemotaxis protein
MSAPPGPDVLIVDDHQDTREALSAVLSQYGYSAVTVEDARNAFALLETGLRPRMILLDLNMPTLSGWGFCSLLAADPDLYKIPVAIITGADEYRGVPHRVVDAGVFRKPLDLDALVVAVESVIGRKAVGFIPSRSSARIS